MLKCQKICLTDTHMFILQGYYVYIVCVSIHIYVNTVLFWHLGSSHCDPWGEGATRVLTFRGVEAAGVNESYKQV